jgi:hypothetical protein
MFRRQPSCSNNLLRGTQRQPSCSNNLQRGTQRQPSCSNNLPRAAQRHSSCSNNLLRGTQRQPSCSNDLPRGAQRQLSWSNTPPRGLRRQLPMENKRVSSAIGDHTRRPPAGTATATKRARWDERSCAGSACSRLPRLSGKRTCRARRRPALAPRAIPSARGAHRVGRQRRASVREGLSPKRAR